MTTNERIASLLENAASEIEKAINILCGEAFLAESARNNHRANTYGDLAVSLNAHRGSFLRRFANIKETLDRVS